MSKPSSSPVIVPMGPELTMPALLWSTEGNEALLERDHNKIPPDYQVPDHQVPDLYSSRSFSSPMQNTDLRLLPPAEWLCLTFSIIWLGPACLEVPTGPGTIGRWDLAVLRQPQGPSV